MPTVIKTTNLCYRSGKRFLLNHINWEVEKGDHWLIFGMNGSGKTTLLSTIAGFLPITEGELFVLNQQYNAMNIFSLRKKSVGSVVLFLINIIQKNLHCKLYYQGCQARLT